MMNGGQARRTLLSSVIQNQTINSRTNRKPAEPNDKQQNRAETGRTGREPAVLRTSSLASLRLLEHITPLPLGEGAGGRLDGLGGRLEGAGGEAVFYSALSTCSLICSSSSFIFTTMFCISAWLLLEPVVLISRPISWAMKPSFLPLGVSSASVSRKYFR